jgi:hypothetical protein
VRSRKKNKTHINKPTYSKIVEKPRNLSDPSINVKGISAPSKRTGGSTGTKVKKANIKQDVVIGTSESNELLSASEKKAWIFVGRLKSDTTAEAVGEFVERTFPNIQVTVEKLESRSSSASFRLSVNFDRKDELMNCAIWPKNTLVKRFLFRRGRSKTPT